VMLAAMLVLISFFGRFLNLLSVSFE